MSVVAVVPMVGAGTFQDPWRPMYASVPGQINAAARTGILGYAQVLSDDGNFALVEFVSAQQSAFKDILAVNQCGRQ
jgi:hypothetical protein